MKVKSIRLSYVLGVMLVLVAVIVFLLLGASSAAGQSTVTVIPKVIIASGGSLSIVSGTSGSNSDLVDLGEVGPGATKQASLTLGVNANNAWHLTVSKSQDLKCSSPGDPGYNQSIASSSFTYTSNGPGGFIYTTTDTEFGPVGAPSNVVMGGTAASGCNVNIVYKLVVPASQPAGYYVAPNHIYTLIVGS